MYQQLTEQFYMKVAAIHRGVQEKLKRQKELFKKEAAI